ncbi:uncharacterized protein LOC117341293 [Pecten maximus]|uniref:uncharacterized protein LOC117341293 n=1 Tax=Pecten maximus TaxID=6579 RepID=UPI001458A762|nr:uncharacterized protein LOC117341293 [Pecten maximus]XP_033759038.1 uncharacterized protein LOC117341293 [Pecten maximus]
MKLQPLLFDTSTMYGTPGFPMPSWGRWSQPSTIAPVSRQPYERLREYPVPQASDEIPSDFWEPVVPNRSTSRESRTNDDRRERSDTGRSIPISIEHVTTGRSEMYGMYDDRICDYNQTSNYDDYGWGQGQTGSQSSRVSDERTDINSNANGARLKTNEYARCTRSSDERERTRRTRSDLYTRTSYPRSRTSDNCVISEVGARPERSREDLVCTGVQRPSESRKCDYEDIDAQIAASYGYDMGTKDENDFELKVNLPKSPQTPVLSKLRTLKSSNMYIILDEDEEEEVKNYKKTNPSMKKDSDLPEILNSRGEFYDLCEESYEDSCKCEGLVVNLPPPKVKSTPIEKPDITPAGKCVTKAPADNRNISDPPSYPAYNIIRKVISSFGGVIDYIRGDGNCFFRALSKVIYGDESCHGEVRQAMVDIMEKFPKDFEQFIDNPSIQDHFKEMRKDGVWATQAEIYGAASFLQRDIYVLSPDHTGDTYRWLLFSPRLQCSKADTYHTCHVTLCHTNGNHYDRIAPATGDCNCGVAPPVLNGTNLQVDLTSGTDQVV